MEEEKDLEGMNWTFFFCRCGMALTGLRALAAAMVSFWICVRVALLDFRSVVIGFPSVEGAAAGAGLGPAEAAVAGSEVMRSMSVVPEDSWPEAMVSEEA